MTSKQFFKYLLEPDQMNDSSVVEMEQLIKQFPFFQTGHMLYLKALSKISDKLVKEKLPTESIYISDRAKLYALLNTKKAQPAPEPKKENRAPEAPKTETEVTKTAKTETAAPKPEEKKDTQAPAAENTGDKKAAAAAVINTVSAETPKTETKAETKVETKVETTVVETKVETKKKAKAEAPAAEGGKQQLSNEERKQNHERLVKDFFELNEIEKYETVATNIAEDGSIKSAAAEFAARSKADPTLDPAPAAEPAKTEKTEKTVVVETKTTETKPADTKPTETVSADTKPTETKPADTKPTETVSAENKDQIFEKIAALRKEQEEADKKRAEAEEEARKLALKLQAEEAERLAKEAEAKAKAKEAEVTTTVTETVTTTIVTETVTATEPAKAETKPEPKPEPAPEPKAEAPKEEAKEMSAADKLMARLKKMKQAETEAPKSNSDSLIDKFLQAEPHLDRNKEVKEGDMGEDSNKQPELYSEKLAQLYIQQQHYAKAISIYEKLNLKYPEKSAYFAAKIEEISKLTNNNQ